EARLAGCDHVRAHDLPASDLERLHVRAAILLGCAPEARRLGPEREEVVGEVVEAVEVEAGRRPPSPGPRIRISEAGGWAGVPLPRPWLSGGSGAVPARRFGGVVVGLLGSRIQRTSSKPSRAASAAAFPGGAPLRAK